MNWLTFFFEKEEFLLLSEELKKTGIIEQWFEALLSLELYDEASRFFKGILIKSYNFDYFSYKFDQMKNKEKWI